MFTTKCDILVYLYVNILYVLPVVYIIHIITSMYVSIIYAYDIFIIQQQYSMGT